MVQSVVEQIVQPVAQPINTEGSQLVQTPDRKLFIPSNIYPVLQPVQDQPMTLQTITLQGANNQAFKGP